MAWYTLTHGCGHIEHVQLYGPVRDRQRRADWQTHPQCRDCRNAAAAEASAALPALSGSDKQVAWANTIRVDLLRQVDGIVTELDARGSSEEQERARMLRQLALQMTSASWWIDRRRHTAIDLLREVNQSVDAVRGGAR